MKARVFDLNERRPISPLARVAFLAAASGYVLLTLIAISIAHKPMEVLPWAPVAQSLVVTTISITTAVILYAQASAAQQRGYFWLAGGFLFYGLLQGTEPLVRQNIFTDGALLGNEQSRAYIGLIAIWAVPIMLLVSAWLLRYPDRTAAGARETPMRALPRVAIVLVLVLATVLIGVFLSPYLPPLREPDGTVTLLAQALAGLWLLVFLCATVVAIGFALMLQTLIHRWIAAVAFIVLGQAAINVVADPWSLGWYYNRALTVVTSSLLLIILLVLISRALRSTTLAASEDYLTKAETRFSLTRGLSPVLARGQSCTFIWIDLDEFKAVNDELGHEVGDQVLKIIADRITTAADGRGRVGRLGGDEFGVAVLHDRGEVIEGFDEGAIDILAADLAAAIRRPIETPEWTLWLSSSIGIATAPVHATTASELLKAAELAMSSAKDAGNDRIRWFNSGIGEAAAKQAQTSHQMTRGIQRGEFNLDYQPIVRSSDHQVIGVESLVRWQRGDERVAAGRFIELAERTGKIVDIGNIVIRELERDIGKILDALPPGGFISLNLSTRELLDRRIIQRLLEGPLAMQASSITVEVTESLEIKEMAGAQHNLDRLRLADYEIAIDDFGSGYSSLSQLGSLKPSVFKVDRSLILSATSQGEGEALLAAAVQVARSLHCHVVAEGIETDEQESAAASQGVDFYQGYRFGRPMKLDQLLERLGESRPLPRQSEQPVPAPLHTV